MFTSLTRKETRILEAEDITTPVQNIIYNYIEDDELNRKLMDIIGWNIKFDISADAPLKEQSTIISKSLGCKPLYKRRYEFLFDVWGIDYRGYMFVLYLAKGKGFSIQCEKTIPHEILVSFINDFHKKLLELSNDA